MLVVLLRPIIFSYLLSSVFAYGGDVNTFQKANNLYDQGNYQQAYTYYQEFLNEKSFGDLYFNMGNVQYRLENKGRAMAYYLAAREHLPRDPDVRANLHFVHEQTLDRVGVESDDILSVLMFWKTWFTTKELLYLTAVLWFFGLLLMVFCRLWPSVSGVKEMGVSFVICSLVCIVLVSMNFAFAETWGAVTVEKAKVYSGPGDHNAVVFELHEAAAFKQKKRQQTWFQIELSDGRRGWVSGKDIMVLEVATL